MLSDISYSGPERREFPRLPIEAPIEVLYPSFWEDETTRLLGMTQNVSEGGVCFMVDRRIPHQEIVVHLDYQGMGAEYILGTIVKERAEAGGGWTYHCRIQRMLGAVDPMSMLQSSNLW